MKFVDLPVSRDTNSGIAAPQLCWHEG